MAGIRPMYDRHGVEAYYRDHAAAYENPHFPEIKTLLERNFHRIDHRKVLDFAAGGGEVTQVLQALGTTGISGADPFTQDLYTRNTGLPCASWSFLDVIKNGLPEQYSTIVCSFAMHLCPTKGLFSLCWNLFQAAPVLLILTPHKRPELENIDTIRLLWEDIAYTDRRKRVSAKAYGLADL